MINQKKPMVRRIVSGKDGQMIVLMGFILLMSVVVLAVISADLSSVGTEVHSKHAGGLLPKFMYIKDEFGTALENNIEVYGNITEGFDRAHDFFYRYELQNGNYFEAVLNQYAYGGSFYSGAIYLVSVSISLEDGNVCITQDVVYTVIL